VQNALRSFPTLAGRRTGAASLFGAIRATCRLLNFLDQSRKAGGRFPFTVSYEVAWWDSGGERLRRRKPARIDAADL